MKKLIYDSALLLLGCLLWTGCNNDEDLTVYSTEGAKTELGQKIIVGSDGYVGQYFSDTTYTLAPGVKALEMEILSATGMAVKMFVLEVDLKDTHLTMKASSPKDEGKLKTKQQMTLQALAHDKQGSRVLAAVNGDFFATDGTPQGIYYRNGVCLKNTMTDNVCTFFAVTKGKKAVIGSYDEYDTYKDEIQEAVGGRVRLMTNGNVLPQTSVKSFCRLTPLLLLKIMLLQIRKIPSGINDLSSFIRQTVFYRFNNKLGTQSVIAF